MTDAQDMQGQELEKKEEEWAEMKYSQLRDELDDAFRLSGALFDLNELFFWHRWLKTATYKKYYMKVVEAYRPVSQRVEHMDNAHDDLLRELLRRCYLYFDNPKLRV